MKVLELMNPRAVTVGPKTPLHKILKLMLHHHLNDVVVVDSEQRPLGMVTYSDLARKVLPSQAELMEHQEYVVDGSLMEDRVKDITRITVDAIMTRDVISVSPDLEALKAGATMTANRVKQLPVVQDHKVVGIISHTDISWGVMLRYSDCMRD